MPDLLAPDDFRSLTGPLTLQVRVAGTLVPVELTVESVQPLPPHRLRAAPFSLILSGPRTPLIAQATYALRHPRLGSLKRDGKTQRQERLHVEVCLGAAGVGDAQRIAGHQVRGRSVAGLRIRLAQDRVARRDVLDVRF